MDEVAARSAVSKQTVYQHFAKKEALFVEIVTTMTDAAGDEVINATPALPMTDDVGEYLRSYAYRQLTIVLTPRLMQLRRLVIGEVSRFPVLAKVLHERGPQRATSALATTFEQLGRSRSARDRRSVGRRVSIQLADHVCSAEPGHAAGRRRDSEGAGASPACGRRRAHVPGGVRDTLRQRPRRRSRVARTMAPYRL